MTFVFVRERSAEGIREALLHRRTAVYMDEKVIAEEPKEEKEVEFVAFRERLDMGYGRTKTPEREAELNAPKTNEEIQVDTFKIDM